MVFVNYNREREELAAADVPAGRAVTTFVTGREESGKTALLQWFRAAHGIANRILYIDVADPAAAETPRGVMSTFITELRADTFEDYWTQERENFPNIAIIRDVQIQGSNNEIKAVSGGVAIADQLANLIPLTRAFVAGVMTASGPDNPVVLCVDGYSSTEELTRLWIRRQLVRMMRPLPFARLVIAGRKQPDPDLLGADQDLHIIELRGIHDVGEWLRAAQELGCILAANPREVEAGLRMLIDYADGHPGNIMSWLRSKAQARHDR